MYQYFLYTKVDGIYQQLGIKECVKPLSITYILSIVQSCYNEPIHFIYEASTDTEIWEDR